MPHNSRETFFFLFFMRDVLQFIFQMAVTWTQLGSGLILNCQR